MKEELKTLTIEQLLLRMVDVSGRIDRLLNEDLPFVSEKAGAGMEYVMILVEAKRRDALPKWEPVDWMAGDPSLRLCRLVGAAGGG